MSEQSLPPPPPVTTLSQDSAVYYEKTTPVKKSNNVEKIVLASVIIIAFIAIVLFMVVPAISGLIYGINSDNGNFEKYTNIMTAICSGALTVVASYYVLSIGKKKYDEFNKPKTL